MTSRRTNFSAYDHGFHFLNAFDFFFEFDLPFLPPVNVGKLLYGLCGGMCFGALDYFHAGRPIPNQTNVPADGSPLHLYLAERQMASLTLPRVPLKVIEWMLTDDETVWGLTVERELPKLRASLDAQKPAVLALVRGRGVSNPTQNHQVVALDYELNEPGQGITIGLYDPNHPGQEPSLTLSLVQPMQGPGITQSTSESVRGFFVINYRRHAPPGQ